MTPLVTDVVLVSIFGSIPAERQWTVNVEEWSPILRVEHEVDELVNEGSTSSERHAREPRDFYVVNRRATNTR